MMIVFARSHWCCKKDLTPVVTQVTKKQVQRYIISKNYTYVTDYKPCDPTDVNNTLLFCPVHKTDIVYVLNNNFNLIQTEYCRQISRLLCPLYALYGAIGRVNCYCLCIYINR